jgi:LacI family transcriptional regulator
VVVDHVQGGYLGTRHLVELGHTRIGFIGRPQDPFIRRGASGPRVSGYRQALEESGLVFREEYFRPGEYSRADGHEQAPSCSICPVRQLRFSPDLTFRPLACSKPPETLA